MSQKKKILFIDRDGTIIVEPEDFQVDSIDKLEFLPGTIGNLGRISRETDFELVMVTNQDGLGTDSLPEAAFWPAHDLMLKILESEGVVFSAVHIDRSLPEQKASTRKPNTGMLQKYMTDAFDLSASYVIGDRVTDIQLAKNLGARAIYISDESHPDADLCTRNWDHVYRFLRFPVRSANIHRQTNETDIRLSLNLDGKGEVEISTGLGFLDHMLQQLAYHGSCNLTVDVKGDLEVDEHHTMEDTALALGEAFRKALGNKKGIDRFGFVVPMDDSRAEATLDLSGRSWLVWEAAFTREKIGDVPTEMFFHFFKSFTDAAKCNLHIRAEGENEHHKIEAIFKAVGRAVKMAVKRDEHSSETPSSKGIL